MGCGIRRPLFLHWLQQYHPVHCRPALRHLHALTDGPVVKKFECQEQLQHHLTGLRTCLLDRRLTVEPIPNPSVGVSPFLFCPPDDPATAR